MKTAQQIRSSTVKPRNIRQTRFRPHTGGNAKAFISDDDDDDDASDLKKEMEGPLSGSLAPEELITDDDDDREVFSFPSLDHYHHHLVQ